MNYLIMLLLLLAGNYAYAMTEEPWVKKLAVDKLHWQDGIDNGHQGLLWDATFSVQKDLQKIWLKTHGIANEDNADKASISAGYQRAFSPFWDWQAGVYSQLEPDRQDYLLVGVEGVAPFFVHIHSYLLLNDKAELRWKAEASHELRLSDRWLLLSDLELLAQDYRDQDARYGRGLTAAEFTLRAAWQWQRWMPYAGIAWEEKLGDTRRLYRQSAMDVSGRVWMLGVNAWF